jgi:hypothetical protein
MTQRHVILQATTRGSRRCNREKQHRDDNGTPIADIFNVYPKIYIPLEVLSMAVLAVSSPITLINLYRRHKRKMAMRKASAMLLKMSHAVTAQCQNQQSGLGQVREWRKWIRDTEILSRPFRHRRTVPYIHTIKARLKSA